jgi:signal peptidase I
MVRDRWFTVLLAYVLPGLPFLLNRMWLIGSLVFFTIMSQLSIGAYEIFSYSGNTILGWYLIGGGIIIWIVSFVLSYKYSINKSMIQSQKSKNPYLIILLTLLLPGLGQVYNRKIIRGLIILLIYIGFFIIEKGILPWYSEHFFKAVISYLACNDIQRTDVISRNKIIYATVLLYATNLIKTGFLIFFCANIADVGNTIGISCEPTLKSGDKTLIDRMARTSLRRGDLVVFIRTDFGVTEKVGKRIIAFEGETVEISRGHIKVNGNFLLNDPFLSIPYNADTLIDCGRDGSPYTVPTGCIYVLGDNPKESEDSRHYGGIDLKSVQGVNYKIILPFERIKLLRSSS